MAALKISYKDPGQLKPRGRNPRTHSPKQIKQIAASIAEFGFISPVLIDGSDRIIAGHGRVDAAKLIGMTDVPTVRVDHLSPAQIRAYVIADNKLAENALIRDINDETTDEADQVPEIDRSIPAVSRLGDRWHIGDHILLCGISPASHASS